MDDNEDVLKLYGIVLKEAGLNNIHPFSNIKKLIHAVDRSTNIYVIDYHLSKDMNGAEVANMIKDRSPESEFVFISGLLSSDEYENIINTCGCNAIARKDDYEKIIFLIKRAICNINKKVIRAMEIVLEGKALLEKIEQY